MSDFSVADELVKLKDLLDKGVLTQEEFEQQKQIVLRKSMKNDDEIEEHDIQSAAETLKKEKGKPTPQPKIKTQSTANKSKKKTPIIAIAAILAVCILAGVLFGTGALGKKSPAVQETEELDPMQDFKTVGSIVTFGSYEQDNDTSNGKEPIEWIVLDVQDGKSLLISNYALDTQQFYNTTMYKNVTWGSSSLRKWLNDTFIKEAFSTEEQMCIPTVTVTADKNPRFDTDPGEETQDQVFLLSITEVNKYFISDAERQCKPTAYAVAHKCTVGKDGNCWWWLRSPGGNQSNVTGVRSDGSVDAYGDRGNGAVRPAMWINTDAAVSSGAPEASQNTAPSGDFKTVGSIVTFGSYEQDNDTSNGEEPIEWIVLDVQDGKSLLISKYVLDCQRYNTNNENITWETCRLRTWLNGTFLNKTFSSKERGKILKETVKADYNPIYYTDPGEKTQDRVFLLSISEVKQYFVSDVERQCKPTVYAIVQGCDSTSHDNGACWWWLRSPGRKSDYSVYVSHDGSVNDRGVYVSYDLCGVRPALWVNLD